MDIQAQITKVVDALTKDKETKELFAKEPGKAVEKVLGVDLPDGVVDKVVAGVKAKLGGSKISGAIDSLKKIF